MGLQKKSGRKNTEKPEKVTFSAGAAISRDGAPNKKCLQGNTNLGIKTLGGAPVTRKIGAGQRRQDIVYGQLQD